MKTMEMKLSFKLKELWVGTRFSFFKRDQLALTEGSLEIQNVRVSGVACWINFLPCVCFYLLIPTKRKIVSSYKLGDDAEFGATLEQLAKEFDKGKPVKEALENVAEARAKCGCSECTSGCKKPAKVIK